MMEVPRGDSEESAVGLRQTEGQTGQTGGGDDREQRKNIRGSVGHGEEGSQDQEAPGPLDNVYSFIAGEVILAGDDVTIRPADGRAYRRRGDEQRWFVADRVYNTGDPIALPANPGVVLRELRARTPYGLGISLLTPLQMHEDILAVLAGLNDVSRSYAQEYGHTFPNGIEADASVIEWAIAGETASERSGIVAAYRRLRQQFS